MLSQIFVTTIFCRDKHYVMTKLLLWQAYICCEKHVCHDKTFVMTKMILVAAPAHDGGGGGGRERGGEAQREGERQTDRH